MPTVVDLAALDSGGFTILGDAANDLAGFSVSLAGDINGDGFDDIVVGAPYSDHDGVGAGRAYVIFGKASGFGTIDLRNLQPADGFVIRGDDAYNYAGFSVSGAGDVNGDGFDDIIVGGSGYSGFYYGGTPTAYVIFGKQSPGTVDLKSLAPSDGFVIQGEYGYGFQRFNASDAGDINGDGFADIIIGDPAANGQAGAAYVIFGKASGFGTINLASLASPTGFVIEGGAGDRAGVSVSGAGDVNGDGFDDLIVGAYFGDNGGSNAGEAYVIFGKASGFGTIDLANLAPAAGFAIQGDTAEDWAGFSVSAAGDINGDGFGDLIIGAPLGDDGGDGAGEAYVIFGKASGFSTVDLTNLAASAGFIIQGDAAGDAAGWNVSAAGDVNGDGFDDLIVGAPSGDDGGSNAGEAYVIFGKASGFGPIDLANLDPAAGFVIQGASLDDRAGQSVSGGEDINSDGFADLLVGAPTASDDISGRAYVIFGAPSGLTFTGTDSGDTLTGGSGSDVLDGRGGDDVLVGNAGNDRLSGGSGNDLLIGGAGADIVDGGAGDDRILYDPADNASQITGGAGNDTLLVDNMAAPVGFNLAGQGFEAAEVTRTDPGGNPWSRIVSAHNAAWQLSSQDVHNDDGTRTFINLDESSTQSWTQDWFAYDAQGRLSSEDVLFDDGTRTFINLDEAGTATWAQDWLFYDPQGRLDSEDILFDNGSRTHINVDQDNSKSWAQDWFIYDGQGRLDGEVILFDDGTRTFINLDEAGIGPFAQIWFNYDSQGRLDTQDVINDDGGRIFYNHDQAGTEPFVLTAFVYKPGGILDYQVIAWDDGTTSYTYF